MYTFRYYNGKKYVNGSMLPKTERFLSGKTRTRIPSKNEPKTL